MCKRIINLTVAYLVRGGTAQEHCQNTTRTIHRELAAFKHAFPLGETPWGLYMQLPRELSLNSYIGLYRTSTTKTLFNLNISLFDIVTKEPNRSVWFCKQLAAKVVQRPSIGDESDWALNEISPSTEQFRETAATGSAAETALKLYRGCSSIEITLFLKLSPLRGMSLGAFDSLRSPLTNTSKWMRQEVLGDFSF